MLCLLWQVKRLIAVLSVPGVNRRKLLEGSSLEPGPELTLKEQQQLEAAGWTPGTTIRSLLNFAGACCETARVIISSKIESFVRSYIHTCPGF